MLSIGDFARHGGVSVRMLRHYDALGLLQPQHVDEVTGYRRYTAAQLSRLNRLVALKDLGCTLEELRPLLDEGVSAAQVRELLDRREQALLEQLRLDSQRLRSVRARLRLIESEDTLNELEFVQKALPALRLAQVSERLADTGQIPERVGPMFERAADLLTRAGLPLQDPVVAWYEAVGDQVLAGAGFTTTPEAAELEGLEAGELAAVDRAITTVHQGPVEEIADAWQALQRYVEAHGDRPTGPCREVYLSSPSDRPEEWVTELQQPVA